MKIAKTLHRWVVKLEESKLNYGMCHEDFWNVNTILNVTIIERRGFPVIKNIIPKQTRHTQNVVQNVSIGATSLILDNVDV